MATARKRRIHFSAVFGTIPMIAVAVGVYVIGIAFTVYWSFTSSGLFPNNHFVGLRQYRRLWQDDRWLIAVQNIWVFGILLIAFALVFGYLLAVFMDQQIRQEDLLRSIYLYPFAMSLIVTGLIWQWMLDPNFGIQHTIQGLGWTSFHFSPLVDGKTAIYGLVVAGIWQGSGVTMAILLSGLRGIDAEIWKAARIDGIPDLARLPFHRAADDEGRHRHRLRPSLGQRRSGLRPRHRDDGRRPRHRHQHAGGLRDPDDHLEPERRARHGRRHDHALAGGCRARADRAGTFHRRPQEGGGHPPGACDGMTMTNANTATTPDPGPAPQAAKGPRGPKPHHLSAGRMGVYGFLVISAVFFLLPLYVMVVTSLKTMPEIRQGHLFGLPQAWTIQPWIDAWLHACTGRDCNGLSPGFWNSIKITVPSVSVSIVIASINGYALSFWRYKGSNLLFGLLVFGAFVPYQVVIYPLIIALRDIHLFATLPGIIIIHTIFGMPILTILFRNYYAAMPGRAVQGRADRRRRGSGRSSCASCCRCRCRSPSSPSSCR